MTTEEPVQREEVPPLGGTDPLAVGGKLDEGCPARQPGQLPLYCTRAEEHPPPHVACARHPVLAPTPVVVAVWWDT